MNINRTESVLLIGLILGLLLVTPAQAFHNECAPGCKLSYCQNVGKVAYCKASPEARYGKIVGVSWQYAGTPVGRYNRPMSKDGYCYIVADKDKKYLVPVERAVNQ